MPTILPSRLWAVGENAPSNKLNVALIGCGGRGADILGEAIGLGVNVIALCDADVARIWYCDTIHHPPQEATADLETTYGKVPTLGAMLLGDKGTLYAGGWGGGNLMKLKGEAKMRGVSDHPAAKSLPFTEPRAPKQNHMLEWMEAAKGGPKTYQPFEIAAHSMEVMLPGIVALRMQRTIDWDGPNMKVPGAPEADVFIQADHRRKWLA